MSVTTPQIKLPAGIQYTGNAAVLYTINWSSCIATDVSLSLSLPLWVVVSGRLLDDHPVDCF